MADPTSEQPGRVRVRIDGKAPRRGSRHDSQAPVNLEPEPPAECDCPRLDPEEWNEVENDWSDITFLKTTTTALLGVPMGYDSTRKEVAAKANAIGATIPEDGMLLLGSGRFRRPLLLEVEDAPEHGKGIERPGGIAFTMLVEAPWGQIQGKVEETRRAATERYGRGPDNVWVWYLTCRECSHERNFETLIVAHYRHPR
ncbi:MAG TPA: hydrolase [Tepidiformaceae bacterium]|nr:hydrolase [Tepidiformaceae bacterium]